MVLLLSGGATASAPGPLAKRRFGDNVVAGEGQGASLVVIPVVAWGGGIKGGRGGRSGVGSMVQQRDTFVTCSFRVLAMGVR